MKTLAKISAAVRSALGRPILSNLAVRAHAAAAEADKQKMRQAEAKLPQPLRLWLLARRKRACAKRRFGDSAKSPAANRYHGQPRLGRAEGRNSYAEHDGLVGRLLVEGVKNPSQVARERLS